MILTNSTGFCGKDGPQAGVLVFTKEPGEDTDKPAIGEQPPDSLRRSLISYSSTTLVCLYHGEHGHRIRDVSRQKTQGTEFRELPTVRSGVEVAR